jgi:hypothetical protein
MPDRYTQELTKKYKPINSTRPTPTPLQNTEGGSSATMEPKGKPLLFASAFYSWKLIAKKPRVDSSGFVYPAYELFADEKIMEVTCKVSRIFL